MGDSLLEQYYMVTSNKNMLRILLYLGERKREKATKIIKDLSISPGSFYDYLRKMEGIVRKDESGLYTLTDEGRKIYRFVKNDRARLNSDLPPHRIFERLMSIRPLFPIDIYEVYGGLPRLLRITFAIGFFALSAIMSATFNFTPIILYGWPAASGNFFEDMFIYVLNMLMIFLLVASVAKLFNRGADLFDIFLKMPFIMWPQTLYIAVTGVLRTFYATLPRLSYQLGFLFLFLSTFYLSTLYYETGALHMELSILVSFLVMALSLIATIGFILQLTL